MTVRTRETAASFAKGVRGGLSAAWEILSGIECLSVVFGLSAAAVAVASMFQPAFPISPSSSLYWFLTSLGCFVLPHLKAIRFKDLEVELHNIAEVVAAPSKEPLGGVTSEFERKILKALDNDKWKSRTTGGVIAELAETEAVTKERVKAELRRLKREGDVVRLTGTDERLYWALTSTGRARAQSPAQSESG